MPDRPHRSTPDQFFFTSAVLAQCGRCRATIVVTHGSDPRSPPKLFRLCAMHDCTDSTPLLIIRPPIPE